MEAILSVDNTLSNKKKTTMLFLLIIAGFIGNYFGYEIFFSIQFIFGSIFAMLALQFFGLKRGILAGAITAARAVKNMTPRWRKCQTSGHCREMSCNSAVEAQTHESRRSYQVDSVT